MSGIAGFWYTDAPPPPGLLERMTAIVAHRGPDGIRHWVSPDGRVGLAQLAFWTTPEAVHESQPLVDELGRCVLTLDGRVDNREELRRDLEARGAVLRDDTDAELVLKSYLVWGADSTRRILGDFAYAIWDERERRLFCARDFLGIKPLFYYHDGRKLLFGSQVRQLFADPAVPRAPDEVTAGVLLATTKPPDLERTLFAGIRRLPPAHSLRFGDAAATPARYWSPPTTPAAGDEQEHAEQLREVLRDAVRCRLRHHGRVGADLSGGLDSSSVVATSWQLIEEGGVGDPGLEVFSWVFPGQRCDESPFIDAVVSWCGLKGRSHLLEVLAESGRHDYLGDVKRDWELPAFPNDALADAVRPLARDRGIRIMLSGCGGDEWLTGSPYQLADELRRHHLGRVLAHRPEVVWRYGVQPLLVSAIPSRLRGVVRRRRRPPAWLEPRFAQGIELAERAPIWQSADGPWAKRSRVVHSLVLFSLLELWERCSAAGGIEDRYPLNDRRLVELSFSIPDEACWRRGETKHLLRRALAERLPPAVRERRDKAEFSVAFALALASPSAEEVFGALVLEQLGWVRGEELRRQRDEVLDAHRAGATSFEPNVWGLWLAYGLELWYREIFARPGERSKRSCEVRAERV